MSCNRRNMVSHPAEIMFSLGFTLICLNIEMSKTINVSFYLNRN